VAMWLRIATILEPWYEQIAQEARGSAVLHADETGCRVNGQTWWLWCFANGQVCYYMIDRSRGSPALVKFFADADRQPNGCCATATSCSRSWIILTCLLTTTLQNG